MNRGQLIVIEGADGAGKTTQVRLLERELAALGYPVERTRQPSDGAVGREIRRMLTSGQKPWFWTTLPLLFAADRMHHQEAVILPMLDRGKVVVCDRYDLSNLIYQANDSERLAWVRALSRDVRRPDLTVVLTVASDDALERVNKRDDKHDLYDRDAAKAAENASLYGMAKHLLPRDRIALVRGDDSFEAVAGNVLAVVLKHLKDAQ